MHQECKQIPYYAINNSPTLVSGYNTITKANPQGIIHLCTCSNELQLFRCNYIILHYLYHTGFSEELCTYRIGLLFIYVPTYVSYMRVGHTCNTIHILLIRLCLHQIQAYNNISNRNHTSVGMRLSL